MPTFWKTLLLSLTLIFSLGIVVGSQERRKPTFAIVAYLPDYILASFDASRTRYLTDLIYFSIEPKPDGTLDTRRAGPDVLTKLKEIRKQYKGRILIALGGWERSAGFAPVAKDPQLRTTFTRNLTQFCRDNSFDGADFDWEHPKDEAAAKNYGALVAETKRAFQPHNLTLSVTLAAAKHLSAEGYRTADRIQIMSYDHPGKHSTYEQMQTDVESFLKAGAPRDSLCIGVPFYGRKPDAWDTAMAYSEILQNFQPKPEEDEAGGFYFNNIQTLQKKTRYSLDNNLGGIMFWQIGHDTSGDNSLLRAIHQTVQETKKPETIKKQETGKGEEKR
jgi:chitinase